jgi:hypothetical protein
MSHDFACADDAMVRWLVHIAVLHRAPDLDRALDSFDHAREFDQEAIAGCLDDAALVLGDFRVDQLSPMR